MVTFNPHIVDEIVTQTEDKGNYFGLLRSDAEVRQDELHGYEVTMSGRLVLPELRLESEENRPQVSKEIVW
ncbi:MAG TPA: hypothetical protein VGB07_19770 [Blastocatellia bacterium]